MARNDTLCACRLASAGNEGPGRHSAAAHSQHLKQPSGRGCDLTKAKGFPFVVGDFFFKEEKSKAGWLALAS